MESNYLTDSTEVDDDELLVRMESILHQEEAALEDLEHLVAEQRSVLLDAEPRDLLDTLQQIEQVLSRIGNLETVRMRMAQQLAKDADGTPGTGPLTAIEAIGPSASLPLLDVRNRVLGAIVRIAQLNDANGQFLIGLNRVGNAMIDRLMQLRDLNSASFSNPAKERDKWYASGALDVQV